MKTIKYTSILIFFIYLLAGFFFYLNSKKAVGQYENLTDRKEYLNLCGMSLTISDSLKLSRVNWLTKKISEHEN
jgi:hypothetical protein